MESKLWEDVNEGDELPPLEFGPITVKTFALMFAGTRDPNPQHHNRDWNQKVGGSRDMFATTPWHQALYTRYASEWAGPESDFRKSSLALLIQVCPGDLLTITGKVAKKYQEGDDYLVHIEMETRSQLGAASRATATLAMPSRAGGQVKVPTSAEKLSIAPHPQMPEWAKPNLGIVTPKSGPSVYPVSEIQLHYWSEMVEMANPQWTDPEYAKNSRHGGIIAPGPSLMVWTFGHPGQGPDVDDPNHKPFPPVSPDRQQGGGGFVEPPLAKLVLATNSEQVYGVPLRPGDRIYQTSEFVNCSPIKKTHLGWGYFTTNMTTYYNQKDEIVANALFSLFRYGVPEEEAQKVLAAQA